MKRRECYELLGYESSDDDNLAEEMTIKSLTLAIERSIESRLVGSMGGIEGFAVIQAFDDPFILLGNGEKLLLLVIFGGESKYFGASADGQALLSLLKNGGALSKIICEPIVDEYKRLEDIVKADRVAQSKENDRKRDLSELKRLMNKRDSGLI